MTLAAPFDFRVDIAPDASPDGDPGLWSWLDVSAYRRQAADITLNTGRDDESSTVEAADSSLMFDLRDGLLSPRNPYSTLYGRVAQNTPIRYRLNVFSDTFTRTVASGLGTSSSGNVWSAGSRYSVNGSGGVATMTSANFAAESYVTDAGASDLDFVYSVSIPALTTGGPWISAALVRRLDSNNNYRVHTELKPAGEVYLKIVKNVKGTSTDLDDESSVATYTAGGKVWTRIQAVGGTIRARSWVGTLGAEPTSVWHVTTTDGVAVEGTGFGFFQWRYSTNTNAGSLAATIDDMTVQAFVWAGNVPEWSPRWDKSGNDSTTAVSPAGPLRLLGQGDDGLYSPLRRQLPQFGPSAYWPGEDGSDATELGSAVSGGRAATVNEVTFGDDDAPGGSAASFSMNSASSFVRGKVAGNTTGSFSAVIYAKLAAQPPGTNTLIEYRSASGTLRRWAITFDGVAYGLSIYKDDGTLAASNTALYTIDPKKWTAIRVQAVQSGGNVNWALAWHGVDDEAFWGISGTVSGTSARISEFLIPASSAMSGTKFCHLWVGPSGLPFDSVNFYSVSRGYAGERAAARVQRLCNEQGVRLALTAGDSEPMGKQRPGKFLDLLRECQVADLGILYERSFGLGYVPRGARYNAPVSLTLDWSDGDLAEAPQPTDDDQRLRTRWTVSRTGGSEAAYESSAGVAKWGRIIDSVEINNYDDRRLAWQAMFRTALTTVDELRWPTIELDLVAHPEFIPAVLGLRPGSRIRITNPKSQVAGITIDLVVEGVKHELGRYVWDVELACSPASPWQIGVWSSSSSLWSASTTTVQSAVAPGVTTFNISTTSRWEKWSTTASGYQWDLAGETVTVQSVGAATGSGPYVQAVTVLRAQNGISKTIPAGTRPRMLLGAKWAL